MGPNEPLYNKVEVRKLPVSPPPAPKTGGILNTPAGDLFQLVNGETYQFLAYVEFLVPASRPRGNHYHEKKIETIVVLAGSLHALYFDLDTGQRCERILTVGHIATVQPRCAHAYFPLEYSQALELAPSAVDMADTFRYEIPANTSATEGIPQ